MGGTNGEMPDGKPVPKIGDVCGYSAPSAQDGVYVENPEGADKPLICAAKAMQDKKTKA